jgi:hypothetical protein
VCHNIYCPNNEGPSSSDWAAHLHEVHTNIVEGRHQLRRDQPQVLEQLPQRLRRG